MKKLFAILALVTLASFTSCKQEEGEGGSASVSGYVYKVLHQTNDFALAADTIPASKEDVFIFYGDNKEVGDKMNTSPDGFFKFSYLRKGTYRIVAYSTDASGEKVPETTIVRLSAGNNATIPVIYIHEGKANETSIITGKVLIKYYLKDYGKYITNPATGDAKFPAGDVRVYLRRVDDNAVIDDVRTSDMGVFAFQKVVPGKYVLIVYTTDRDIWDEYGEKIVVPLTQEVEVKETGEVVTCQDFNILDIK